MKHSLWRRHVRKVGFATLQYTSLFYENLTIRHRLENAYGVVNELLFELEQKDQLHRSFGIGKPCENQIKKLEETTTKRWHKTVWSFMFKAQKKRITFKTQN